MKVLFIHQNMPGQYVHIARHLAQSGHEVAFITQPRAVHIAGVRKLEYQPAAAFSDGLAYTRELDGGIANGLAVARLCEWLGRDGFVPDIVIGHNGWGEILYIKILWGPSIARVYTLGVVNHASRRNRCSPVSTMLPANKSQLSIPI